MTKFRLTIGENGSKMGKQQVIYTANAKNGIEFLKEAIGKFPPDERIIILKNAWFDAGATTIPVAVSNIKYDLILG